MGQLNPGDVLFIDHTGDGQVDHMANVVKVERDAAGKVTRLVLATGSFDDMKDADGATAPRGPGRGEQLRRGGHRAASTRPAR